jgi:predicted Rossmann-fold nucleotide-binding protein
VKIRYAEQQSSKDFNFRSDAKAITISVNGLEASRNTNIITGAQGTPLEINETVTLGKADLSRIKMLSEELWAMPEINSVYSEPYLEYKEIEITIINKEDRRVYSFIDTPDDADKDDYYKRLYTFFHEVDGLIECHIER